MAPNSQTCVVCGKDLNGAIFLSETFSHEGGTMVFECDCGNKTRRTFVPLDLLGEKEWAKQIAILSGMKEKDAEVIGLNFQSARSIKQLTEKIT